MILLIDNYDSFAYNLVQYFGTLNPDIKVIRNDEMTTGQIRDLNPSHIILSPGPGHPKDAGILEDAVKELGSIIPILGVCLGEQGICEAYGATITRARKLMHGKQCMVNLDTESPIFHGMPERIPAARYHSLVVSPEGLPEDLQVIGSDDSGEIMAVKHRYHPVYGLQFHPESILTPGGMKILANFLTVTAE